MRPGSTFDGRSSAYESHRPSYPPDALTSIVKGLPRPIHALDLGCGTGISTRALAVHTDHLVGCDPNAEMLSAARSRAPAIPLVGAAAERLPLLGHSLDLIVRAQSFHWFATPAVLSELARALRPPGRLALMWNVRRPSSPFDQGYASITRRAQDLEARSAAAVPRERHAVGLDRSPFRVVSNLGFENPQSLDRAGLLGRALSSSYFPDRGPRRAEFESELGELFDRHQVDGRVTLSQVTEVTLATPATR